MNTKSDTRLSPARRRLAAAIAAAAIASPCYAADWALVTANEERGGVSIYADNSSIRQEGELVKSLTLWNFLTPQYDGARIKQYSSAKVLYAVNCKNGTQAVMQITTFKAGKGKGPVVSTHAYKSNELEFEETSPNSVSEEIHLYTCAQAEALKKQPR